MFLYHYYYVSFLLMFQVVGEEEVVTAGEEVIGGEEVVINGADGEKVVFVTSSGEVAEIPSSGPVGGDASGGVGGDFFVQDSSEVNGGEVIQVSATSCCWHCRHPLPKL